MSWCITGPGYPKKARTVFECQIRLLSLDKKKLVTITFKREVDDCSDFEAYKKQSSEEYKRIRTEKFSETDVAISEILTTQDLHQLAAYANNKNIMKVVNSCEFAARFSISKNAIKRRLEEGDFRNSRLKLVNNFFYLLSTMDDSKLPEIPIQCAYLIFNHLDNKDLMNLRKAYSLKSQGMPKLSVLAKSRLL